MSTTLVPMPAPAPETNVLAIIDRAARDSSIDVSKLERLLDMAERIRAQEAKAAFDQALNAAQSEMRPISRDCHNPQTRSKYASYTQIDEAIRGIYTDHGFAMSFGSKASPHPNHVIVTCRLSHRGGHTEHQELDMPADGKGAKGGDMQTLTHATGSALSYGQRYLAKLIWNLSFGEQDDDGNGASPRPQPRQQATKERPQAKAANVAPGPKRATAATRNWMLHELNAIFQNGEALEFAESKGWLQDVKDANSWKLEHVPTSNPGMAALTAEIGKWMEAKNPMQDDKALPNEIANVMIPIPRAGMTKAQYYEQGPDTIGSLYAATKAGNDEARKRLFGLANEWPCEGYNGQPPSKEELACRAGLDTFLAWRENR